VNCVKLAAKHIGQLQERPVLDCGVRDSHS